MDLIKTGKLISIARKNKGLTQKQLANKLHISDKAISKWERGLGYPDVSSLIPLAQILDITLYELLSGEKDGVEEILKNTIKYSKKEIERNKKKQRKKTIIITSILILLFFIISYKAFFLIFFNTNVSDRDDYINLINGYQIKDVEIIETHKLNDNNYIKYKDLKIKNIFDDFEPVRLDDTVGYQYKNDEKFILISDDKTYIDLVKEEIEKHGNSSKLYYDDITELAKLNNIKTDLELFNYFYESKNKEVGFFSSIKDIKENYYAKYLSYLLLPSTDYITELKGDLNGYIFHVNEEINENLIQISIIHNNKRYILVMKGFYQEELFDILSTLSFD